LQTGNKPHRPRIQPIKSYKVPDERKVLRLTKFHAYLLAVLFVTSISTVGCRSSQPDETVVYNRWEVQTHRDHKDLNQRPPDEQKEHRDWRQKQPDVH